MTLFWSLALLASYAIGRITTTVRLRRETRELGEAVRRDEERRSQWR